MLTLIEGAEIFSPTHLGQQDLLVADGRIAWMGKGLTVPTNWPLHRVDGRGRYLVPGLVDPLAHITGGGGEGGFAFRTPELAASEALKAGVTTLVAALGTDSLTRTPAQVLGKVREFRAAGVSAFMYTRLLPSAGQDPDRHGGVGHHPDPRGIGGGGGGHQRPQIQCADPR